MEARFNELLLLASKIAREFDNIPGLPHAEIELAAKEALAHVARLFNPAKGDFTAYAGRAMRNTLGAPDARRPRRRPQGRLCPPRHQAAQQPQDS